MYVSRLDLVNYLESKGWSPVGSPGEAGTLWEHQEHSWRLPIPHADFNSSDAWKAILERLSMLEGQTLESLSSNIQAPSVDVVSLAAHQGDFMDDISYRVGYELVQSGWVMLRACATTSMGVRPHIRGNYRSQADAIVREARMAHTMRGSYVIPIRLRLSERSHEEADLFDSQITPEPPERRVTRTFSEALKAVSEYLAIPEASANEAGLTALIAAGASSEFVMALHRVVAQPEVQQISTSFRWATTRRPPAESTTSVYSITPDSAPQLLEVAQELKRPPRVTETEILTGPIIAVRELNARQMYEVTVDTYLKSRSVNVSVHVSYQVFQLALEWFGSQTTVVIRGRLKRERGRIICVDQDSIVPLSETQLF